MSEFYGRLTGNSKEVTRTGNYASGITARVETWGSIIKTQFFMDASERHAARIEITDKEGNQTGFETFIDADVLAKYRAIPRIQREVGEVMLAIESLNFALAEVAEAAETRDARTAAGESELSGCICPVRGSQGLVRVDTAGCPVHHPDESA